MNANPVKCPILAVLSEVEGSAFRQCAARVGDLDLTSSRSSANFRPTRPAQAQLARLIPGNAQSARNRAAPINCTAGEQEAHQARRLLIGPQFAQRPNDSVDVGVITRSSQVREPCGNSG